MPGPAGAEVRSLIVTSNFPPVVGGSCQVYAALAEAGQGSVSVLTTRRSFQDNTVLEGAEAFDRAAPYRIWRLQLLRPRHKASGILPWAVHDAWVMLRLLAAISWICLRHRIPVVCIGDLIYGGWLVRPLRYILRRRVIVYVHGEEMTESAGGLFETMKGGFVRAADHVIAVSSFARDVAIAYLGARPSQVSTVLNGVDLDTFRPRPPPEDLVARYHTAGKRVLITVARLIERKGVDQALRAIPAIAAAVPDLHYVVVGDGPDRLRLEALAQELGIAGRVTFTGRIDAADLARIYALADVFVMPNRRLASGDNEGFGLVFLEANASGLPVIAGRAGGTTDAVREGETGFLVDGMDTAAIADAAIALLTDETRRRRMAEAGLAFARSSGWRDRYAEFQRIVAAPDQAVPQAAVQPRYRFVKPAGAAVARPARPTLLAVIDAEERFDWNSFIADAVDASNMRHQDGATAIYARHGIQPTYMIDYPVATQADGIEPLQALLRENACTVGAQLHPWVNPPLASRASSPHESFPGNLPEALERAKLTELTRVIEANLGVRPTSYRAGRYGAGPNTAATLRDLGYRVDCSVLACTTAYPGPDFSGWGPQPAWLDAEAKLLEVPVTVGLLGRWAGASWAPALVSSGWAQRFRIPGALARLGLLERIKLTPEGTTIDDAKRLTRGLLARGHSVFVITYHSSSLVPGSAPYVANAADLAAFLRWLDAYCTWFLDEAGEVRGQPGTFDGLYRTALDQ